METIETILLIFLVLGAVALGVLILMQQGKGADIGAAFGSGSSNTLFGSDGSGNFLTKITTWLAIVFFVISFALAYLAKEKAVDLRGFGVEGELIEDGFTLDRANDGDQLGDPLPDTEKVIEIGDAFPEESEVSEDQLEIPDI
ncbi:MAG: preprotein translocase subunit SecG [Gammaproteobacteria bacterium]|nr:preprotein translocase subunit SecG [Gammaproteobacteria bacterium]MCH2351194.1 preprotein translocase subunit SecG [Pseudomonadales bacterium]MCH2411008.1 preprotein translocase subunit SecG [Myxococcota bacterium]|tara:strand:+ start:9876 stop:10304 length:429 start_codon:yes stop_codon:yes gene_type:complete